MTSGCPTAGDPPSGLVTTYEFDDEGDRTRLTLTISHPDEDARRRHEEMGVVEGWSSSLDCLDEQLQTM